MRTELEDTLELAAGGAWFVRQTKPSPCESRRVISALLSPSSLCLSEIHVPQWSCQNKLLVHGAHQGKPLTRCVEHGVAEQGGGSRFTAPPNSTPVWTLGASIHPPVWLHSTAAPWGCQNQFSIEKKCPTNSDGAEPNLVEFLGTLFSRPLRSKVGLWGKSCVCLPLIYAIQEVQNWSSTSCLLLLVLPTHFNCWELTSFGFLVHHWLTHLPGSI